MVFIGGRWCLLLLILISLIERVGGVSLRVIGGRDASLGIVYGTFMMVAIILRLIVVLLFRVACSSRETG